MTDKAEISLPAHADYLHLIRLLVGAVAARIDMTIEEIEDLHLAVDELCLSILDPTSSSPDRLQVVVEWDDELIEIECRVVAAGATTEFDSGAVGTGLPESLSQRILDALVDAHGSSAISGERAAWLRKTRENKLPES